jgi:hypothetical protein
MTPAPAQSVDCMRRLARCCTLAQPYISPAKVPHHLISVTAHDGTVRGRIQPFCPPHFAENPVKLPSSELSCPRRRLNVRVGRSPQDRNVIFRIHVGPGKVDHVNTLAIRFAPFMNRHSAANPTSTVSFFARRRPPPMKYERHLRRSLISHTDGRPAPREGTALARSDCGGRRDRASDPPGSA